MVSHITLYLPSIATPSLRLFDLILSKTRFSNHISFLSRFLRHKVIPNGFKSSYSLHVHSANHRHTISHRVTRACYEHSRRLMRIAIDSMSLHLSTLDSEILRVKSVLVSVCAFILRKDITQFIRMLNSRLFSFLEGSKASKFNSLIGHLPVSTDDHASSVDRTNLVVTIPPDLTLSDSERSVLAKGLKFVPHPGSLDLFSVKADTESFFRRLQLKAHFHNQPSVPTRTFLRPSTLKNPPGVHQITYYGSLELFI